MNHSRSQRQISLFAAAAVAVAIGSPTAFSQTDDGADAMEEIVTTGTRRQGQSPTETLSPIDVLAGSALANQATFDMTDGLSKVAPSINTQRFPIADGTAFIRPVSLRNLSPDQTLVLVNGNRRHRSPLVNLQLAPLGTVNQGAQAVDFSALPSLAIKRLEILRDGASAQYGSDAIAGVINVILKDANEGISVSAQTGEYYEGDGARTTLAANAGFSLGDSGFLNATIEHSTAEITSRGVQRGDCQPVIDAVGPGIVPLDDFCQRWGDPDVEALKFFLNAGIDVNDNMEIYGNASFSDNDTISDFFYRHPVTFDPTAGFSGRTTLIQDNDGDFVPDPASQAMVDRIIAGGFDPNDYLTASTDLVTNPSGFVMLNPIYTQFPGGYNPDFGAAISDMAFVVGARGETGSGMSWDISGRIAGSEVDYKLSESINPSLGGLSPTSFNPGKLTQEETSLNADFVKTFDVGNLAAPLNFAFGLEWRKETYEIAAGDTASNSAGPAFEFGVGSDGFQGFPTASVGSFDSSSIGAYVDIEADLTDTFTLGAAVRFEDYDEFGNTTDFKLSGRLQVNDQFALRATASTGFRAPTPGQVNTLNTTTTADTAGNLIPSGTYPVGSTVAMVLGSQPLVPEESTSFTVGAIWSATDNIDVTLDYYDISIDDRLALFNTTISAQNVIDLTAAGVPNADLLIGGLANYFANAFDSEVSGFDLAITASVEVGSGDLVVDLRHNQNEQNVGRVASGTINASRVFDLENQIPDSRTTLTFDYDTGNALSGHVRANMYGGWKSTGGLFSSGLADDVSSYGAEILVDLEATYRFNDMFRLSVGAENIFDVEPGAEGDGTLAFLGARTSITSPFGNNGGFWYARLAADF